MLPFLAKEFGLLPWHFGGDHYLTYGEAESFLEAARKIADHHDEQERKAKKMNRGRRR